MRRCAFLSVLTILLVSLSGCGGYNAIIKSSDYDAKYELAKNMYVEGRYSNASSILEECVMIMRGTSKGEESVYLLANCYYKMKDWLMASQYFKNCYSMYTNGIYSEDARFLAGESLYYDTPDPRLDPSSTYGAINELQDFIEQYPYSKYVNRANELVYALYDRLVEKEMRSATLYYNMGNYLGNNYRSGIITAENALKTFPYTKYREELSMLILRCKFKMAQESVQDKMLDRYRDTVDEYYAFKNDFPDSKYMKEADRIFAVSSKHTGNQQ
ncbi:MAG: outer membrane protein assembly factor BamD [Bacteroidaceae bacterium]|nr:outer membrane protein assembly factor BamD [Bacteroidaceae bacterium]